MFSRLAVVILAVVAGSSVTAKAQTSALQAARDTGAVSGAVVTGTIYDSVAHAPLADAWVQMRLEVGSPRVFSAATDSAGVYRIENVPSGRYIATFFHPVLESLGILPINWRVEVGDSVTRKNFAVPSGQTVWAATCPAPSANDSTGLVIGHVHDADSGVPLRGSVVSASWRELVIDQRGIRTERRQLASTTNDAGLYALCGVPANAGVLVIAEHGATSSGVVEIAAPFHAVLVRDFGVGSMDSTLTVTAAADSGAARTGAGASLRRGTARLEGTVRTAGGDPVDDVELAVAGSDARGVSDKAGRFALADLPPGTYTLEARHLGFEPARVIVDLASHKTSTVAVTLDKEVAVLSTVHVYGKRRTSAQSISGFLERMQHGFGHFITRQDIEKHHAFYITDMLRMVPGVQVVPTGAFGHAVVMRGPTGFGNCRPVVYMDGVRMFREESGDLDWLVNTSDVSGVEVYTGPSQAPPEYQGNGCGSIVIWTGLAP